MELLRVAFFYSEESFEIRVLPRPRKRRAQPIINPAAKLVQRPPSMHLAGELHRLMELCGLSLALALYQCKCGARWRLFLIFHLFICLLEWPSCCARGFIVVPPTAAAACFAHAGDHKHLSLFLSQRPFNYKCTNRKIAQVVHVHPLYAYCNYFSRGLEIHRFALTLTCHLSPPPTYTMVLLTRATPASQRISTVHFHWKNRPPVACSCYFSLPNRLYLCSFIGQQLLNVTWTDFN